jgi:hypothetical protein
MMRRRTLSGLSLTVCRIACAYAILLIWIRMPAWGWRSTLYPENWTAPENETPGTPFLHDFSYAGYHRGEIPIPDNPPGLTYDVTLPPYNADNTGTTDATAAIQAAIDAAGAAGGGVVFLPAGTYLVAPAVVGQEEAALYVRHSGVAVRGAGAGKTVLHNTAPYMRQMRVVKFRPASSSDWDNEIGVTQSIASDLGYPATVIPLTNVAGFTAGERVVLRTDCTAGFIADHGMTGLWDSSLRGVMFFREIVAVDSTNNTITIDIPTRYWMKTRDGGRVYEVAPPLEEVGIEDLSISMVENTTPGFGDNDYSVPGTGAYEVHNSHLIEFRHVLNGWARRITSARHPGNANDVHMLSMGILTYYARGVTVKNCGLQKPQYEGGGGNGYMFRLRGNDCLYQDCEAIDSRHNYSFFSMWTSGNVVHRCLARDGRLSTDFHGHLSMANLFDSTTVDRDDLESVYRPAGTVVHGHATTESVFWNTFGTSVSPANIVETRQWGWGYAIGTSGPQDGVTLGTADNTAPEDFVEGVGIGDSLEPQSLYLDQLARRIGIGTVYAVQPANVVGFTFPTASGTIYELQSTLDTNVSQPVWSSTGSSTHGDGTQKVLFDPGEASTQNTYRVIEIP